MTAAVPKTARWLNTQERYGAVSILLHWAMALLLVAVYATMELEDVLPGGEGEGAMEAWHYTLGLGVLVLVAVRLAMRLIGSTPLIHPQPPTWQRVLAKLTHLALYLFMIAMPLLGWLTLSGEHESARIPGPGWTIPLLPGVDESAGEAAEELHEVVAVLGYWLVGLHTVAALVHHYLIRDDTLRRMLPRRSRA
ncbi:cytochrome b [Marilutibacter chinensis]|uniref:Cytochrome b n=1 Tax=Marilutibacter chinensis TaxID=2912247 RepID=A0ABS9HPX7_9GAMM|nr:cytochrome b [Lysobacter chinensis]MCF7220362.1 cytochrome b [Lysobacter chinensis]